jgi:hypothetical protein
MRSRSSEYTPTASELKNQVAESNFEDDSFKEDGGAGTGHSPHSIGCNIVLSQTVQDNAGSDHGQQEKQEVLINTDIAAIKALGQSIRDEKQHLVS